MIDLQRLMAHPDLRCQVARAMNATLPPIPNNTCIRDIAADRADVMLSISTESILISTVCPFHDGVRACVRLDDGECPALSRMEQDVRKGCVHEPLLFNIFFAGVIRGIFTRFEVGKTPWTLRLVSEINRGGGESNGWSSNPGNITMTYAIC